MILIVKGNESKFLWDFQFQKMYFDLIASSSLLADLAGLPFCRSKEVCWVHLKTFKSCDFTSRWCDETGKVINCLRLMYGSCIDQLREENVSLTVIIFSYNSAVVFTISHTQQLGDAAIFFNSPSSLAVDEFFFLRFCFVLLKVHWIIVLL